MASTFKFAACQMLVSEDKEKNLETARQMISEAVSQGAKVVSLPECFNCPYSNASFPVYAEDVNSGPSASMLAEQAKKHQIYLVGGSIPEKDNDKLYNTSLVFDPNGNLIAKHRKVHLFDINIPGKITFMESATLTSGSSITFFQAGDYGKIGIGICYDIRFPEYAQLLSSKGCKFLIYPGAFNMTTGPAHWELLQRGRAVDNQLYVATISPARNPESTYQAWGHSTIVDPWGVVISTTEHQPGIVYADIDFKRVDEVRQQIPVRNQKRSDLYHVAPLEP